MFKSKITYVATVSAILMSYNASAFLGFGKKTSNVKDWDTQGIFGDTTHMQLVSLKDASDKNLFGGQVLFVPSDSNAIYIKNGKIVEAINDLSGVDWCRIEIAGPAVRHVRAITSLGGTMKAPPYIDKGFSVSNTQSFEMDPGSQTGKDQTGNDVVVSKVTCSRPYGKHNKANLSSAEVFKALGKFASFNIIAAPVPAVTGPTGTPSGTPSAAPVPAPVSGDPSVNTNPVKPGDSGAPAPAPGHDPAAAPAAN